MELTEALLEQIGAYLSGRMTEAERQAFDTQIGRDTDLQHEVRVQHELKQGLLLLAQKRRFKTMHTDLSQRGLLPQTTAESAEPDGRVMPLPTHRTAGWPNWNYVTAAASLLLLLGMGWLIFWRQSMPAAEAIRRNNAFDSVFTPDLKAAPQPPIDPDQLGASLPAGSANPDSMQVKQGVRLLQQQQTQRAIVRLQSLAQGTPGHWRASAQWYLALAYLKNGQISQTDSLLHSIAGANGHPYQLEAQRLTNQLNHESTRL